MLDGNTHLTAFEKMVLANTNDHVRRMMLSDQDLKHNYRAALLVYERDGAAGAKQDARELHRAMDKFFPDFTPVMESLERAIRGPNRIDCP